MKKTEIILQFDRLKADAGFDEPVPVRVKFNSEESEVFDFINPLKDKSLSELRWYLESYWQWPSEIDDERARNVEGALPKWGKALFEAVFKQGSDASTDAMRLFGRFSDTHDVRGERVLTIDTNEPRILRLPWELLRDEGGYLFSEEISVRRRMHKVKKAEIKPFDLPVRILMVTCRPDGAGFIDPRSIATPLLTALDALPEDFEVEFLRPPTLKALDERLRDKNQAHIHIVHFDGHGVYDKGMGLGFLLFEDENCQEDQVDAEQLGTLLNKSGIPLMVLNACQSAQSDERNPFASVASRLIESGVGGVVAMNYSVLVETAKRFTKEFYGALGRGESANIAMDRARRDLFRDTKRLSLRRPHREEAQIIHLQDWFLPALYQQVEDLTPFKADGKAASPSQRYRIPQQEKGARGGFPPAPIHGFHGRARELLDLERAFATRRIVVMNGFGGQGKTALATQAAEWFTRTRLFDRAAFISFETGASLEYVLNTLGEVLVEENFQIHEGNKAEAIARSLREKPALIVFDNFESALPGGNAPMPELQALLESAAKWFPAEGRACLLITTRNAEIPHPAFTPGKNCLRKELAGLAASDALEMAASILEAYSLPRPPRVPLEELLRFLRGHPLSLQLALPQLKDYSAEKLVKEYQRILPQMKKGDAEARNESLEVSLRFSLDRLGEDAFNWLARLSVFENGATESVLLAITEIPEEEWHKLKPQLTATALIRVEEIPGVNMPFIHFHPTLAPFLRAKLPSPLGRGVGGEGGGEGENNLQERYWQVYYAYASQLYQDDIQHPIQARAIVLRELPNLKRALQRALAAGALDEAVSFAEIINKFLNNFGRWRERDEIANAVEQAVGRRKTEDGGPITKREYLLESGRGKRLLQQGRGGAAEGIFRALLARLEGDADYDTRYDQTITLKRLGSSLSAQGQPSQAAEFYSRAIALAEGLEQTENVKRQTAAYHVDLADVLTNSGQYARAQQEYEIGLKVILEIHDDRSEGAILGQLGTLAMRQGDLKEAQKRYLEVLSLFQRMGEDQSEAVAWHQLGMVAQEARDWGESERCYKKSLAIKEGLGDWALAATSCNQLAIVSKNAGRAQDAERWYLRAIELGEKLGDKNGLAKRLNNLADLYLTQNRLEEAEDYAHRALAIKETLDLSSEPWTTYAILAQLAEKSGSAEEASEWRRKEQESFAAFAGSDTQIKQHEPLIATIVQAANGDDDAKKALEGEYPKMQAGGEAWAKGADAIKNLVAGERDLSVLTEGLPRETALIIMRVLQALSGETDPSPQPSPSGRGGAQEQEGLSLPQLLELVERAAGGDQELGGQLFSAFQEMARSDDPEMRALGNVLLRVLVGEREPNLEGLPAEVASAVRGMLGRLKNQG